MGRACREVLCDFDVEKGPFGRFWVDGRTTPKRIFKRQFQEHGLDYYGSG